MRCVDVELYNSFKNLFLIVEHGESPVIGIRKVFHTGVPSNQPLPALLILDGHESFQPLQSRTRNRAHRFTKARFIYEIGEVYSDAWIQPAFAGQFGGRARDSEVPKRGREFICIAPKPVEFAAIRGDDDCILPRDLTIKQRGFCWNWMTC